MVSEDFAVRTNRLPEELIDRTPRHFDHRRLQLERGLYVIRERTNRNLTDRPSKEYSSEACGD